MQPRQAKSRKPRKSRATTGRDDMVANTQKRDYYVPLALDLTPHPGKELRAVLGKPVMDRRYKYSLFESTLTASNATSATPLSMVTISQGTTDITRTGDRIRAKRLWLSGAIYGSAAATISTATRLLVVLWNPVGNAAVNAPVASQIVQHSAGYGPFGSYSRDFGDSYQVVYDTLLSVTQYTGTQEADLVHIDRALTVDMEFVAGATTPATNNLYIFLLSDVAANQPTIRFSSTLWYEDLDA